MLSIIVAKAKNNVIGKDNTLIWHISDDLKRFKKITTGHTIIMGRKTFESLGRVLPNRHHVVLCKNTKLHVNNENVEIVNDISMLEKYIKDSEENFVIGGATIYKQLMEKCSKMYITEINKDFEGDVLFPEIDENKWKIVEREKGPKDEENSFDYEYVIYEKIKTR